MSSPSLVYVDTNVFAYQLIPKSTHSGKLNKNKADNFFQDIVNGNYDGVISTFTELEYKGAAKSILSNINKKQVTSQQEFAAMQDFRNFIQQVGIMLLDADILSIATIGKVDLISTSFPIIDSSDPVNSPHSINDPNPWRSIGGADGVTANLAIRSNAKFIATFDRAYERLNHSTLQPIIIQDNY